MNKFNIVLLETKRLKIVKLDLTFTESMQRLSIEKPMRDFIPDEVFETLDDAKKKIEFLIDVYNGEEGPFVYPVILKSNNLHIGHVEAVKISADKWEIGYHIGEQYKNNGYATEVIKAFTPFIMKKLNIKEIFGICLANNIGSRKVLEHCDYKLLEETMGHYLGNKKMIRKYIYRL